MPPQTPTFFEERQLYKLGFTLIAGVDEAGSGAWAGPVFAAAVMLPLDSRIGLVRDSKQLSATQRSEVSARIKEETSAWAVGTASAEEIDRMNIRKAGALAMFRAIMALKNKPEFVLIDAFRIPGLEIPSKSIIRGDAKVKSIAAASIIAKTARDEYMRELDAFHPGYGFADHKGYGTKKHQDALIKLRPCAAHRKTYAPIRVFLERAKA